MEHFRVLANDQRAIASLRHLILALALQGKLVKQVSSDEPAEKLMARIRVAKGLVPRSAGELPSIHEPPFRLPAGWAWATFGDYVLELCTGPFGSLIHKDDYVVDGVPLINPSHMIGGRVAHDPGVSLSREMAATLEAYRLRPGDVLLARRGEVGRYALVTSREDGWLCGTGSFFARLTAECDRRFFGLLLEDPRLRTQLQGESVGTTMTNLNQRILLSAVLGIPPLAEQARIVARVDELMRLCDALEEKGRLEAAQHARLLSTLLGTLTDSATPEELAANWQRVAEHFELLLDRPEAVDDFEQTILHLAVRGRLVEQDLSDAPASTLVEKLRQSSDRRLAPNSADAAPFALPSNWAWVRFEELIDPARPISYGVLVPGPDVKDGVPLVRIADLSVTNPALLPEKRIGATVEAQFARTRLEGGEILMGVVGSIGKLGVAPATWAGANIARAVCRIVPAEGVNREFVLLLLQSEFMQSNFAGDTRTLAQPTLNVGLIRSSPTPLPPATEQARIVARVTELRRLCTALRERLQAQQTAQSRLAEALVEQAVST